MTKQYQASEFINNSKVFCFQNIINKLKQTLWIMTIQARGGEGGVPLFPEINWFVTQKSKKKMFSYLLCSQYCRCSPIPRKICLLFPYQCSPEITAIFPCFPKIVSEYDQVTQGCILAGISFLSISSVLLPTRKSGIHRDKYLSAAIFKEAVHSDDS